MLLVLAVSQSGLGQVSNRRLIQISTAPDSVQLSFNAVVPGSVEIANVPESFFSMNYALGRLYWLQRPQADSVWVSFRVFAFNATQPAMRYRFDSVAQYFKAEPGNRATSPASNRFLEWQGLNYSGSFGRSLTVGNTQDAVVNSLFNLQVNGYIGDSIMLSAAITDNNIPIQPDGTTQQLNEFDRVWMQFKKRNWALNIGDVDVRQQPGYFLSYFKRQQGLAFETQNRIAKNITAKTFLSGAIAKGKFARNILPVTEGNQGPYRLQAPNGELFFVVLAGTERVYIDGVQMQRGEDQDYIINYNTAEISFTPRQLMQKDRRVQVEFEYADRNYLNSLLYAGTQWQVGSKLKLMAAAYSNADSKNAPLNIVLSNTQKQQLSEVGDSISQAYATSAVLDSFSVERILYVRIDTLVDGMTYTVFRYSPQRADSMYNVGFTELAQGQGNYRLLLNASNGRAYEWVAPVNGVLQGNFEPVVRLVTPKKQQMFTAGMEYNLLPSLLLKAEGAWSVYDINTFSSKDKSNDRGAGYKSNLFYNKQLHKARTIAAQAGYEYVNENFRPLERLRTIEFLRDWGLPFTSAPATEQLPGASVTLSDTVGHQFQYQYQGYLRSDSYSGHRQQLLHQWQKPGWQVQNFFQYTGISAKDFDGFFLRPRIDLSKTIFKGYPVTASAGYALEHNELHSRGSGLLLPTSFSFTDFKAALTTAGEKRNRWGVQWFQRRNQFAATSGFIPLDINNNLTLRLELLKNIHHQVRMNAGYRNLKVITAGLTNQQSDNTFTGRLEYVVNMAKGAVSGNMLYEAGAGQEQQRNFSYVEVPAGRGEYVWNDYDNDGVPQLNEFEVAQFQDQAKYVRIFIPTNQFVKAAYNAMNISLLLSPVSIWRDSKVAYKKLLSRFVLQSSLQTTGKQITEDGYHLNPFSGGVADTSLIYYNFNWVNTISYNRFSTNWGVDFTQVRNSNKALLTYGTEGRAADDYSLRIRKNFGKTFVTQLQLKTGSNELITPNPKFDNRNYSIEQYAVQPAVTYQRGAVFRMQATYGYTHKKGLYQGLNLLSTAHSLQNEAKLNLVQKGVVTGKFTYTKIDFNGEPNSTVGFIMLDALQPGNNYLWSLDLTRRLANALEISFQYEGRKPGDTRVVHIGRAALRAIL